MRSYVIGLFSAVGLLFVIWLLAAKEDGLLRGVGSSSTSLRKDDDTLAQLLKKLAELESRNVPSQDVKAQMDALTAAFDAKVDAAVQTQFKLLRTEMGQSTNEEEVARLSKLVKALQDQLAATRTTPPPTAPPAPKIDDFTSCINYATRDIPAAGSGGGIKFAPSSAATMVNRYEAVRIGVSNFCTPHTTDVSIFFTAQSMATGGARDCLNEARAKVSVRFRPTTGAAVVKETKAQMVGCFQDDKARSWRFFAVRLSALIPEQKYTYTLEHEAGQPERQFFAPPLAGSDSETDIVFVGDTMMPGVGQVIREFTKVTEHDLVVHVGDGSYGTNNGECYYARRIRAPNDVCGWNCTGTTCEAVNRMSAERLDLIRNWINLIDKELAGRMAWMTTMGNHDNDLQWFLSMRPTCASALPGVSPDDVVFDTQQALQTFAHSQLSMKEIYAQALDYMKSPHFYSFDYGKVHVISLGSEDNPMNAYEEWDGQPMDQALINRFELHFGKHSKQYKWLVKDLSEYARRTLTPWVIVFTHRPLYSTANHHPNCQSGGDWFACMFRDTYEPVFKQFGVDLVVSGHSHHYSRSHPMYKGVVDPDRGIVHVVIGVGGFDVTGEDFQRGGNEWVASRQGTQFGYVRMSVKNATHAKWTHQLVDGTVFDETWLVRRS